MNRFMLLAGIFLSMALPFVSFPAVSHPAAVLSDVMIRPVINMSRTNVMALPVQPVPAFSAWQCILILYWSGVAIMFFLFVRKLVRVRAHIKNFPKRSCSGYIHVITLHRRDIFSFGKYLFAPADIPEIVYKHELVHILEKHSVDNLLMEIVKIFCWFNPVVYLYQREMKVVHEYIADARVTASIDKSDYAHLLVSYLFQVSKATLTHRFFNRSQLQKRLIMLQKKNSSRNAA